MPIETNIIVAISANFEVDISNLPLSFIIILIADLANARSLAAQVIADPAHDQLLAQRQLHKPSKGPLVAGVDRGCMPLGDLSKKNNASFLPVRLHDVAHNPAAQ